MSPSQGYLIAAAGAAIAMVAAFDFSSGGVAPPELAVVELGIAFVLIAIFALIPSMVAVKFAPRNPTYLLPHLIACSCLTAAAFCGLAAVVAAADSSVGDPDSLGFSEAYVRYLPWFLPGALVGGGVLWLLSREEIVASRSD